MQARAGTNWVELDDACDRGGPSNMRRGQMATAFGEIPSTSRRVRGAACRLVGASKSGFMDEKKLDLLKA